MNRGNRNNLPLRGKSASERVFESLVFRVFWKFLEIFRGSQRPSETLSEADFPLRDSQSFCPWEKTPPPKMLALLKKQSGTQIGLTKLVLVVTKLVERWRQNSQSGNTPENFSELSEIPALPWLLVKLA